MATAVKGGGRSCGSRARRIRGASGRIVGTVQLDLERRANGSHRAELIKLMVHRAGAGAGSAAR